MNPDTKPNISYQTLAYGFVAGLAIGILSMALIGGADGEVAIERSEAEATSTVSAVIVRDQKAGAAVLVDSIEATDVSWVAVRENNYDVMGRILGARKVAPGMHENVTVELLRPTAPNVMYAVVLYRDDGDGIFDHKLDELLVEGEEPVLSRFVAE